MSVIELEDIEDMRIRHLKKAMDIGFALGWGGITIEPNKQHERNREAKLEYRIAKALELCELKKNDGLTEMIKKTLKGEL